MKFTAPERRRNSTAIWVGIIGGILSGIVKLGWEVPFPPRTPARNAVNPPQTLLEQIGFSEEISRATVNFNGWDLPISSFIVHFGFSIAFGIIYCVVAERWPKIKLWQGMAFGLFSWVFFHILLMPALQTVPAPWNQPFEEHFSEAIGHMVWMWSIEVVRRDLRNRYTKEPDAEVPLP